MRCVGSINRAHETRCNRIALRSLLPVHAALIDESSTVLTNSPMDAALERISTRSTTLSVDKSERTFQRAFIASVATAVVSSIAFFFDDTMLFTAVGLWALVIVLLPAICTTGYNLFSPWTFVVLTVFIGMTLRGIAMSFGLPSDARIDQLFLLGNEPNYFYYPSVIILSGLAMSATGYILASSSLTGAAKNTETWQANWVWVLTISVLGASLVAAYLYIDKTGGFQSGLLSAKRTTISGLDIGSDTSYRSYGSLRKIGQCALFAHLILVAYSRQLDRQAGLLTRVVSIVLLVSACVIPFYSSSRSDVAMALISSLAVSHILGGSVRISRIALIFFAVSVLIFVMTLLRQRSDLTDASYSIGQVSEQIVINRNELGISKTGHIINAVPETLEPQWGKTIMVWLFAPIPRGVWPEKPLIHQGPVIGRKIYGNFVSGVPPGIIAELYWNFFWPGVLVGMLLFGAFTRLVSDRLILRYQKRSHDVLLYAVGPMMIGPLMVGSSIGSGLFNMAVDMTIMKIMLMAAIRRE